MQVLLAGAGIHQEPVVGVRQVIPLDHVIGALVDVDVVFGGVRLAGGLHDFAAMS
jgi:hypothetical protein